MFVWISYAPFLEAQQPGFGYLYGLTFLGCRRCCDGSAPSGGRLLAGTAAADSRGVRMSADSRRFLGCSCSTSVGASRACRAVKVLRHGPRGRRGRNDARSPHVHGPRPITGCRSRRAHVGARGMSAVPVSCASAQVGRCQDRRHDATNIVVDASWTDAGVPGPSWTAATRRPRPSISAAAPYRSVESAMSAQMQMESVPQNAATAPNANVNAA